MKAYVASIDPILWAVRTNIRSDKMYGLRTTNFVESEHNTSAINGIRHKLPFPFVQASLEFVRDDFKKKSDRAKLWTEEGRIVTPAALQLYEKELKVVGSMQRTL